MGTYDEPQAGAEETDAAEQATPAPVETNKDQYGNVLDEHPFYCPVCGRRYDYQRQCIGSPEQPHSPTEVVSTNELAGPAEDHTAAPGTE